MYHYNDFEAWQHHRDELLQEAGMRRVARQLRAARFGESAPRVRNPLPSLIPGSLLRGRKMAGS
jgi:hypothetical protein